MPTYTHKHPYPTTPNPSRHHTGVLGDAYYKHGEFETAANHYHSALKSYERHYRSETGPESLELVGATQLVAWNLLSEVRGWVERWGGSRRKLAASMSMGLPDGYGTS